MRSAALLRREALAATVALEFGVAAGRGVTISVGVARDGARRVAERAMHAAPVQRRKRSPAALARGGLGGFRRRAGRRGALLALASGPALMNAKALQGRKPLVAVLARERGLLLVPLLLALRKLDRPRHNRVLLLLLLLLLVRDEPPTILSSSDSLAARCLGDVG